ncbi:O-antigen ligase family protein [Pseudomonas guariconensis]|uniref:O-antigen ligase family protein n=1 Tax=Pseudomonas guariconensis TaxID=1288410 RepID=UPI002B05D1F7|nr:O-antigen ligase family protein [Pseudomonas guariconensis]
MSDLLVFNRARLVWLSFVVMFFLACALEPMGYFFEKAMLALLGGYGALKISTKKSRWEVMWFLLCFYVIVQSIFLSNLAGCLYGALFLCVYLMGCGISKLYGNSFEMTYIVKTIAWMQCVFVVFGIVEVIFVNLGKNVFYRDYFIDPYRADSFYTNPNPFAIVSVLLILMLLSVGVKWSRNKLTYLLLAIGTSLGGAAMAGLCAVIYIGVRLVSVRPIFVMLLLVFCIFFPFLVETNDLVLAIYNKRVQIWDVALSMLSSNAMLGIGFGVFQKTNYLYEGGVGPQYGLHSMYYAFLVEGGYIGFSLLLACLYVMLRRFWCLNSTYYAVFVALLFSQLTEFYLDHEEIFMLLFAVCLATLLIPRQAGVDHA